MKGIALRMGSLLTASWWSMVSLGQTELPARLEESEMEALAIGRGYEVADQYPVRDGYRTRYLFGAGQPTMVCAPLRVCLIELEAGERIGSGGIHVGDTVRWNVKASLDGAVPTLVIKPAAEDLETTMVIITDRRTYHLKLKSDREQSMPAIAWIYPERAEAAAAELERAAWEASEQRTIPEAGRDLATLDFAYTVSGCERCEWRPLRVYNDGAQTVIQIPPDREDDELPALLLVSDSGEDALVNYRVRGNHYIVDTVFQEAVLVAGTGRKRQRVVIERSTP